MVWKILTSIAMVLLLVSGYLGWKNKETLELEVAKREKKQSTLDTTNQRLSDTYLTHARTRKDLTGTQTELEGYNAEIASTKELIEQEEAKVADAKSELQALEAYLVQAKEDLKEVGSINEVLPKIDRLKEEIKIAEMNIAKEEETLRFKQGTLGERKTSDRQFRTTAKNQKIGKISPNFASSIRRVYNDWGFVVLNAGDRRGLYSKATLDVKRGNETVGQLKVTNVEPTYAVADILGPEGQISMLRAGDRVVKAMEETAPVPNNSVPESPADSLPADTTIPTDGTDNGMGEIPTDFGIPTEIPTEIPTDSGSDLPTIDTGTDAAVEDDPFSGGTATDGVDDPFAE